MSSTKLGIPFKCSTTNIKSSDSIPEYPRLTAVALPSKSLSFLRSSFWWIICLIRSSLNCTIWQGSATPSSSLRDVRLTNTLSASTDVIWLPRRSNNVRFTNSPSKSIDVILLPWRSSLTKLGIFFKRSTTNIKSSDVISERLRFTFVALISKLSSLLRTLLRCTIRWGSATPSSSLRDVRLTNTLSDSTEIMRLLVRSSNFRLTSSPSKPIDVISLPLRLSSIKLGISFKRSTTKVKSPDAILHFESPTFVALPSKLSSLIRSWLRFGSATLLPSTFSATCAASAGSAHASSCSFFSFCFVSISFASLTTMYSISFWASTFATMSLAFFSNAAFSFASFSFADAFSFANFSFATCSLASCSLATCSLATCSLATCSLATCFLACCSTIALFLSAISLANLFLAAFSLAVGLFAFISLAFLFASTGSTTFSFISLAFLSTACFFEKK